MPPKIVQCFRIAPELKAAVERLAKADKRSVSEWIEMAVAQRVAAVEPPKRKER